MLCNGISDEHDATTPEPRGHLSFIVSVNSNHVSN